MRRVILVMATVAGVLLGASAQAAAWTVTTLDVGSSITQPWGINDAGVVVGYADGNGFIDNHGSIQTVAWPAVPAGNTALTGISNSGLAVGGDVLNQSFYYQSGVFTPFSVPGSTSTVIRGISANGRYITGSFVDASGDGHGFVWDADAAQLSTISAPAGSSLLVIQGVNDDGVATGSLAGGGALLFDSKTGTSTTYSGSFDGLTHVSPRAINDAGLLGGWAYDASGDMVGFVGTFATGFSTISAGAHTVVYGLDDLGQAVGFYDSSDGIEHGFIASSASAVSEPSSALFLLAALAAGARCSGRREHASRATRQ
jgi:hypothetical protein